MNRIIYRVLGLLVISALGVGSYLVHFGPNQKPSARITVDGRNPPTIKLGGDELLDWIDVFGPLPEKISNSAPIRIWKLVPISPLSLNTLPSIVYGDLPSGFIQEE